MAFTEIGFLELLAILTQLGSFGVDPAPKTAPPAELLRYAPAQPDYIVYADLQSVLPNNYKALVSLPNKLKSPDTKAKVRQLIKQVEQVRQMAKGMINLDPVTDLESVTVFVKPDAKRGLEMLAVVRGKFTKTFLGRVATFAHAAMSNVAGSTALSLPGGKAMAAVDNKGSLLVGTPSWIKARLQPNWKPVKRPRNSTLGRAARVLRGKPFFAAISAPSAIAKRGVLRRTHGAGAFVRQVLTGHTFAQLSLAHNGISWTWADTTDKGYKQAIMASEGVLNVFRAMHYGTRGLVNFAFAAMGSYAGKNKVVDLLLKHQARLLKVVKQVTGNGRFRVRWQKNRRTHTVSVRAYAQRLSQVVPLSAVTPILGAMVFIARGHTSRSRMRRARRPHHGHHARGGMMAKPMVARPAHVDPRWIYRRVKRRHLHGGR